VNDLDWIGQLCLPESSKGKFDILSVVLDEENITQFVPGIIPPLGPFAILNGGEYGAKRSAERKSQSLNAGEGGIAFSRFDVTDIRAMQIRAFSEFFLRNSELNSTPFYFRPKAFLDISRLHEEIRDMKH